MKRLFFVLAASAALFACKKNDESPVVSYAFEAGQKVTLSVGAYNPDTNPDTKVIGELTDHSTIKLIWQKEDSIEVTVGGKSAVFYKTSTYYGDDYSADFAGYMPASGNTFNVRYPCSSVSQPDVQVYYGKKKRKQDEQAEFAPSYNDVPEGMLRFGADNCTLEHGALKLKSLSTVMLLRFWSKEPFTIGKIEVEDDFRDLPLHTLKREPAVTLKDSPEKADTFLMVINRSREDAEINIGPYIRLYDKDGDFLDEMKISVDLRPGTLVNLRARDVAPLYLDFYEALSPVKINGLLWAPKNCGDYQFGRMYQWNRVSGCAYNSNSPFADQDGNHVDEFDLLAGTHQISEVEGNDPSRQSIFYVGKACWFSDYRISWKQYDPCPKGFHLPTKKQLEELVKNHSLYIMGDTESIGGYRFSGNQPYQENGNWIFLPCAGRRTAEKGSSVERNCDSDGNYGAGNGYYWTSNGTTNDYAACLMFNSSKIEMTTQCKSTGCSVRCVKDIK